MKAQNDKVVGIIYDLFDKESNEKLDSNKQDKIPLEFLFGRGNIIYGLEQGIEGLKAGESKQVVVEPKDGYGNYEPSATGEHNIEEFEGIELKVGMSVFGQSEDGEEIQAILKSFDDKKVVLDYNHPLAGKTLLFDVEVVSIREATQKELDSGMVGGNGGGCCGSNSDCCNSEDNK